MTDDDTMALLARVQWLEAENQRLIERAAQAEADRDTLAAEVEAWRKWFDREPETIITEPLGWQDVINKRAATDAAKAMEEK
jgi:hypothetical protein